MNLQHRITVIGRAKSPLVALLLVFAIGTPDAPGVALIPTVGGKSFATGCEFSIHGCGRDERGQPCGMANGVTCFCDEELSFHGVDRTEYESNEDR